MRDYKTLKVILMTTLVIVIFLGGALFSLSLYNNNYQRGIQDGATLLYTEILSEVLQCDKSYTIIYQNQTLNLVLYECFLQETQG